MRYPVQSILDFNRGFDARSLKLKFTAITQSPFAFFRATFHLFAEDMVAGPFRKLPVSESRGRIVADLHTENFGGYRAVAGDLVYDINDFDDSADGQPYEFDLRRLMTSILLGGVESGLRLGEAVSSAETAARAYFETIGKFSSARRRQDLEALHDPAVVRRLLHVAEEKPRVAFIKALAEKGPKGSFEFKSGNPHLRPVDGKVRREAEKRFAQYLAHCTAPAGAKLDQYRFEDIVFRYAGKGSLGKNRYAVLMSKDGSSKDDAFKSLRVVEWKDSSDSPLRSAKRKCGKSRNREVCEATIAFQMAPKRYLGYLEMFGRPMQARELGANDCRFGHHQYATLPKLEQACGVFGGITARAHLLASLGTEGPRKFIAKSRVSEDHLVHRLVAFATSYAARVHEDFEEIKRRKSKLAKEWKALKSQ